MTDQKILMEVLSAAVNGGAWDGNYKADGYKLYRLAMHQGIESVTFPVFEELYKKGLLEIKEEDFNIIKSKILNRVMKYAQKQFSVYTLLQNMRKEGIDYIVMKGDTLSYLYAYPDYRISGDVDILIDKDSEKECCTFFKKHGADVGNRADDNNERVITHKTAGLIEVHIAHNTKTVSEVWYDNIEIMQESTREMTLWDAFSVKCMGYTDTAVNMILHFIKHYISGIAHLRMLADTLLFIDREYDNIDINRLTEVLQKLKYQTVFACMKYIGCRYLNLKHFNADEDFKEIAEDFLEDIFVCAEQRTVNSAEIECYAYYSEKKYNKMNPEGYHAYNNKLFYKKIICLLFPDKYTMKRKYAVLKKHISLLPFMYIYRWIDIIFFRPFRKNNISRKNDESSLRRGREKLIDRLDMI